MKENCRIYNVINSLLWLGLFGLFGLFCLTIEAQKDLSLSIDDFRISIKKSRFSFELQCENGCAWKSLIVPFKDDGKVKIDEFGMHNESVPTVRKDTLLYDFLFAIEIDKDEVLLEGIKGTSWTELIYSTQQYSNVVINKNGMIK